MTKEIKLSVAQLDKATIDERFGYKFLDSTDSHLRTYSVDPDWTVRIELTDEQVAELTGERVEIHWGTFMVLVSEYNKEKKLAKRQEAWERLTDYVSNLVAPAVTKSEQIQIYAANDRIKELENKLAEKDLFIANGEKQNAKLVADNNALREANRKFDGIEAEIAKLQAETDEIKAKYAPVEVTADEADLIKRCKVEGFNVYQFLIQAVNDTASASVNRLACAYLNGYTINQEKKYRVELPSTNNGEQSGMMLTQYDDKRGKGIRWINNYSLGKSAEETKLTQQEIESVDPRYMAFAVEVE